MIDWESQNLSEIKCNGLGQRSIEKLAEANIFTVADLLAFRPRDYLDYSEVTPINDAPLETPVLIRGAVISKHEGKTHHKKIPVLEILVDDGFGTMRAVWFNQPYLNNKIDKGAVLQLRGKIRYEKTGRTMNNPRFQMETEQRLGIEPIYRQINGLRSDQIAKWIQQLIMDMPKLEFLPKNLVQQMGLPSRPQAFATLHAPENAQTVTGIRNRSEPALKRLIFDEFYGLQERLQQLKARSVQLNYLRFRPNMQAIQNLYRHLPFQPTVDQNKVIEALFYSLSQEERIQAMIQGDVGCGKTLIGFSMAVLFAASGYQSAFLCPTTVLANQHYLNAKKLLTPLGIKVTLLTGQLENSQLRQGLASLASGETDLVIGTHKLFSKDVQFAKLGLAMVDEQHRFGVDQRGALLKKGSGVHYMAFSATPIPRSLAMTLYGEYQIYQIRNKPQNRMPIKTILKKSQNRGEVIQFAHQLIGRGASVFWVFPLIEGEEENAEKSATHMHQQFQQEHFEHHGVGLVHGRLDKEEVAQEMERFRSGKIKVLVATTVIEVGVDVPNASIIVIEGANRFGLSQLHQLRGRVGRGSKEGFCFLMVGDELNRTALKRLRLLESSNDGFEIAEYDLKERGAGELLGKKQSGEAGFRFGDPWLDRDLMMLARKVVQQQAKS